MKKELTILVPSWRGPHLLKTFLPFLQASLTTDAQIIIILNEYDKESVNLCAGYGVEFIAVKENYGTLAVDLAIPFIKGQYILNINDDMIPSKAFDRDLISIINDNYPCSASTFLVEPRPTNNCIVIVDDLGDFETAAGKFVKNFQEGKYRGKMKRRNSGMHPIMVRKSDFMAVNGYSNGLDMNWMPGFALDDDFIFRLWTKYNQGFKFITSGESCCYHGISMTNDRLPKEQRNRPNADYFWERNGLSIQEFQMISGRGQLI